jgi:hypothetical protein
MKYITRIFIVLISPIIGLITGFILARYEINQYKSEWEYLGMPPEKPKNILSIYSGIFVLSESNRQYNYNGIKNEWEEINQSTFDKPNNEVIGVCKFPSLPKSYIDEMHYCIPSSPVFTGKIVYIDQTGKVYFQNTIYGSEGEALILIYYPLFGVIIFLLLGLFIVCVLYIKDLLIFLKRKRNRIE